MLPQLGVSTAHRIQTKFSRAVHFPNVITHAKFEINWLKNGVFGEGLKFHVLALLRRTSLTRLSPAGLPVITVINPVFVQGLAGADPSPWIYHWLPPRSCDVGVRRGVIIPQNIYSDCSMQLVSFSALLENTNRNSSWNGSLWWTWLWHITRQDRLVGAKVKVNFEINLADRKSTTCLKAKLFLLRCVNPAALSLARCYSIRHPRRVASWVNYSSRQTVSYSEHFVSDQGLLKADALWCENKRCSDSNPCMTNGSESECATHYTTAPHIFHCASP